MTARVGEATDGSTWPLTLHRRQLIQLAGSVCAGTTLGSHTAAATQSDSVTLVSADPEKGFNYPYYLYTPAENLSEPTPFLVEPNNTGTSTNDFEEHRIAAEGTIQRGFFRSLSDELALPFLVPVFPRPNGDPVDYTHYTHALDAETMAIDDGPLERIDEQLLAMVADARDRVGDAGFQTTDQLLLNGFSASGTFVNRFTALHPGRVAAVTAGGINGTAILPRNEAKGHELPFPIGVANLEALTGESFDLEAWRDVDQLTYMGGRDQNDTIPYNDAWNDRLREIALDVYGEDMQQDRMAYCQNQYEEAGATGRVEVYPGIGHRTSPGIREEMTVFHRKHLPELFVEFGSPPTIDSQSLDVIVSTDSRETGGSFAVRAFGESGTELTAAPVQVEQLDGVRTSLSLTRPVEKDESVTIGVFAADDAPLADALTTETVTASAGVSFTTTPTAGDGTVDIAYELSSRYDAAQPISIWVTTEQGGLVDALEVTPGASGEVSIRLPREMNGVLLEQSREITVEAAHEDPVDGAHVATETVLIAEPDEAVVDLTLAVDPVIERGERTPVEVEVRGLGGSAADLPLSISVNGETVTTTSVSVAPGETTTTTTDVPLSGTANPVQVTAQAGSTTARSPVVMAEQPAAGSGTSSAPYEVASPAELAYLAIDPDSAYELTMDIELAPFERFPRIGSLDTPFSGTLDGQSNEIRNLRVRSNDDQFEGTGLFGNLFGGTVRDLHLLNVDIRGGDFTGGLLGMGSSNGHISGVTVSGTVVGDSNVGGIVGGTSTGPESGDVTITEVVSHAAVAGQGKVAGILGQSSGDPVHNAAVHGPVSGEYSTAGITAWIDFGGTVTTSYARGPIEGSGGGIASGIADGSVEDAYWDVDATGQPTSEGGGTGLETAAMTGSNARSSMEGLDFEETWQAVSEDYPQLRNTVHPQAPAWSVVITDPGPTQLVPEDDALTVTATVINAGSTVGSTTVTLEEPLDQTAEVTVDGTTETTVEFDIPAEYVESGATITVGVADYKHTRTLSIGDPVDPDESDTSTDVTATPTPTSTPTSTPTATPTSTPVPTSTSTPTGPAPTETPSSVSTETARPTSPDTATPSQTAPTTETAAPGLGVISTLAAIIGAGRWLHNRDE